MPRKYKDLTGRIFGYLTVIEETSERIKGAKVWFCRCKCGNTKKVKTDYLQQGWTKSCGCYKIETARLKLPKAIKNNPKLNQPILVSKFNTLLRNYKSNAKKRDIEFELTKDEIFKFTTEPCHYCGYIPNGEIKNNSAIYGDCFNGIDRKDSDGIYSKENCVPCCGICNVAKNKMKYDEFAKYIDRLVQWRKK